MYSRHCHEFSKNATYSFGISRPFLNIRFSASFWQPLIDVSDLWSKSEICGPLLGLFLEWTKKKGLAFTFMEESNGSYFAEYDDLVNDRNDIFLYPTLPNSSGQLDQSNSCLYSKSLGIINMISILSAEGPKFETISLFGFIQCFSNLIWAVILLSFALMTLIWRSVIGNWEGCLYYFRCLLNQPLHVDLLFRSRSTFSPRTKLLKWNTLLWMTLCGVLISLFANNLVSHLIFSAPPTTIESLADLARFVRQGRTRKIYAFTGEPFHEYLTRPKSEMSALLNSVAEISNVASVGKGQWERRVMSEISIGRSVLVTDSANLAFYHASFADK